MNRSKAGRMGFQLLQPLGADPLAGDAVRPAPFVDPLQLRELLRRHGDDDFPAARKREVLLLAEGLHLQLPVAAIRGSQRPRFVVDARMQHARVAARLVKSELAFLLEYDELRARMPFEKTVGRGQPHDSATDDGYVNLSHERRSIRAPEYNQPPPRLPGRNRVDPGPPPLLGRSLTPQFQGRRLPTERKFLSPLSLRG